MFLKGRYGCIFVIETYEIEDCVKYINSSIKTGNAKVCSVFNMPNDFEITYKLKSNGSKANRSGIQTVDSNSGSLLFGMGSTWSDGYLCSYAWYDGTTETSSVLSPQTVMQTNIDYFYKIKYENGIMYEYIDNALVQSGAVTNIDLSTIYMYCRQYRDNNTQTITDLKIKPL